MVALEPFGRLRSLLYVVGLMLSFITFVMWCYVVDRTNDMAWYISSPSEFNFAVFAGLFALLATLALLFGAYAHNALHYSWTGYLVHTVVETGAVALVVIFWFCAAVATAALVGTGSCAANLCRVSKAAIAFSWFSLIPYGAALALLVMQWLQQRRSYPTANPMAPLAYDAPSHPAAPMAQTQPSYAAHPDGVPMHPAPAPMDSAMPMPEPSRQV
ncbi:hypothetical protein H4R34_001461 [Dimargaris verticillata]|uniref:MARVEL domain-containing protein n=1 Tax=Dimargaris verticillata TaxID=2761393 RepID=A0A9W8BAP7_9FUNG|nr:hypothetical protein H4R34_001461 [Dimargaris verticillata]